MKRFFLFCTLFATIAAAGCSDNDGPSGGKTEQPAWESTTHARLLKFSGKVKHVSASKGDGEEMVSTLKANFDTRGNCTAYNDTGIDLDAAAFRTTRDWGVSAAWYTYSYDAAGHMTSATKYEVGSDPVVYTITYGTHGLYVPTPFPLGNLEPFFLKGIARIEAPNFTLTSDGTTTVSTQSGGFPPATDRTTYTYSGSMPVKAVTVSRSNHSDEELFRTEFNYIYDRNTLVRMDKKTTYPEGEGFEELRYVTLYSSEWPFTVTAKECYEGTAAEPAYRLEFKYAENGLPLSAAYTVGMSFEPTFSQHYTQYDAQGNWTAGIRGEYGMETQIRQTATYY